MRYETVGDWFYRKNGDLVIRTTLALSTPEGFLIALHELAEAFLCSRRGITAEAVDAFDMAFTGKGEPGDDPDAPYRHEHRFASLLEGLLAHEIGLAGYRVES